MSKKDVSAMEKRKKDSVTGIIKKTIAAAAIAATKANVNSACNFVIYQPKLPKGAEKLRKF